MNVDTALRVVLLVGGVILLGVIYLVGRLKSRSQRQAAAPQFEPPQYSIETDASDVTDEWLEQTTGEEFIQEDFAFIDEAESTIQHSSQRARREPTFAPEDGAFDDGLDTELDTALPAVAAVEVEALPASPLPTLSEVVIPARNTAALPAQEKSMVKKLIALRVAVTQGRLSGVRLLELLQAADLQYGRFGVFHYLYQDEPVFSVASMVEPGYFRLDTMQQLDFPGITLFMTLPGPQEALRAFDVMIAFARQVQHVTDGVLQDERGHPLTPQALQQLRAEVQELQTLDSAEVVS